MSWSKLCWPATRLENGRCSGWESFVDSEGILGFEEVLIALRAYWNDVRAAIHSSEAVVFIGYSLPAYDSWSCCFFMEVRASKPVEVYNPDQTVLKRA
jgi:hypothetical protein